MLRSLLLLTSFCALGLYAQAPTLAVDANANRHPISPYIYGINEWSDSGLFEVMHIPILRWGGDDATSYNWQSSVKNNTGDNPWCYENYSVSPDFDGFHNANLAAGTVSLGTIPLMDWSPKAAGECSFSVAKYGAQKAVAPDNPDCGNGVLANGNPVINDPNDAYVPVTQSFAQQWVQHIMSTYGPANAGGVRLWSMDNEPEWWYSNHVDVYPQAADYDDMLARNIKWATAVKSVDPTALVTGPVPGGWSGMLFSRVDMNNGWATPPNQYWDNPTDQKAHGGIAWVPYYLQQMSQFQQANGYRLLDYLDVHAYIAPSGLSGSQGDAAMETLRMTSTRALWDPNYLVPGRRLRGRHRRRGRAATGSPHAAVGESELSRHQPGHHRIQLGRSQQHHRRHRAGRYPRHFRRLRPGSRNTLGRAGAHRSRRIRLQNLPELRRQREPVRQHRGSGHQRRSGHPVHLRRAAGRLSLDGAGAQQDHRRYQRLHQPCQFHRRWNGPGLAVQPRRTPARSSD